MRGWGEGTKDNIDLLKGDGGALNGDADIQRRYPTGDGKVIKVDGYAIKGHGETLTGAADALNGDGRG